MAQEEQQGVNPPTMRPVVLPEPYNGESSWTDWYEPFESMAAVNRWKNEEKLLWLRVRLVDRAATAFKTIPEPARVNFANCIEAQRERSDPSSKRQLYLAELLGRKKCWGKEWATFAEALKTLIDNAYPEMQDDAKEQLGLTHYLGQLEQQQLAFSVKQRRPKSVDATVSATLEMESYLVPKGGRVAQVAADITSTEPVAAVRDQQDAVMSLLQQVMQHMDQLEERVAAMQVGAKSPRLQRGHGNASALDKGQAGVDSKSEALSFAIDARKRGTWPEDVLPPGPNKDAPHIRETERPRCNWPDTGGRNRGQIPGTNSPQCTGPNTAGERAYDKVRQTTGAKQQLWKGLYNQ